MFFSLVFSNVKGVVISHVLSFAKNRENGKQ